MALKLPRTIRLDPSDTFVYARAAEPGEWAVTGTFLFFGADVENLSGKERQAFRGGFLGVESFGWSTLVVVTEATAEERAAAVERLAEQLVARCGAPGMEAARPAAEEEIAFVQSLCDHPPNTLLALHRADEEAGIRESFRTLHQKVSRLDPARAFRVIEIDEEDGPAEEVDIRALAGRQT
ncbi:hypothetical protein KEU06_03265 [Pseudaminobacter sp. 19-2017]|uniref:Uncharacterized protein n=1 Tax=Pseudaminobacter soli (ex Zhang et al. 2022) TaxID=2831468 RepID=A0A942I217_9HYPH|nr:DUF6505 family protein [Pseudaminobacter soli]MBS3647644.1 hypothetical protein [Pseudaminobacter soli]